MVTVRFSNTVCGLVLGITYLADCASCAWTYSKKHTRSIAGKDGNILVPDMIYGTAWKKDDTASHTIDAVKLGYRGIDTANQLRHYDEAAVGDALSTVMEQLDLAREDIFIQTKYTPSNGQDAGTEPYDVKADVDEQLRQSLASSLSHLGITYIDSYLMHDPMQNHEDRMKVWRAMEAAYDDGTVKLLGISNINAVQLGELLRDARIKPAFVQNRFQSTRGAWDAEVRALCFQHEITYQAFSVVGSNRGLLTESTVMNSAHWHGVTTSQILFRFAIQAGTIAITGTSSHAHKNENLELGFVLAEDEMQSITQLSSLPYNASMKISAKFWNELPVPVSVFWRSPKGKETLSYSLPAGQTAQDAVRSTAQTFHAHEFVVRAHDGTLMTKWRANAANGDTQEVPITHQVAAIVQNHRADRVDLFWRNPDDGSEVPQGGLEGTSTGPLAAHTLQLGTYDTHEFVVRDVRRRKVDGFQIKMRKGMNQIITIRRQGQ
eukprot:m.325829 g.325829  ORF g.325829 m.325829 type:complete len:491 (-) comp20389_c1_seq1:734-2206(-)